MLSQADFLQAFVNSLVVSSGAVLLSLCIGVPAAYAFARFPFRGGSFLFFSLLVMRMLPPIAVLVPMYILFSKFGLTTTRFSVVLAYTTFSLPLVVWIMPASSRTCRVNWRKAPGWMVRHATPHSATWCCR